MGILSEAFGYTSREELEYRIFKLEQDKKANIEQLIGKLEKKRRDLVKTEADKKIVDLCDSICELTKKYNNIGKCRKHRR